MAEHQKGSTGFLLSDQMLDLRDDLRFPLRNIVDFLAMLIPDVRNPYAIEIRRCGAGAQGRRTQEGCDDTKDKDLGRVTHHAGKRRLFLTFS
jgi:hypothetical protein